MQQEGYLGKANITVPSLIWSNTTASRANFKYFT